MAITWISGNSGAGKTTLAEKMLEGSALSGPYYNAIWLDGDNMREIWKDLKLSKEDRIEQNMRIARLAKMLGDQGYNVIVSVICPYKQLRKRIKELTNCKFIYIEGGKEGKDYPYDKPNLY